MLLAPAAKRGASLLAGGVGGGHGGGVVNVLLAQPPLVNQQLTAHGFGLGLPGVCQLTQLPLQLINPRQQFTR